MPDSLTSEHVGGIRPGRPYCVQSGFPNLSFRLVSEQSKPPVRRIKMFHMKQINIRTTSPLRSCYMSESLRLLLSGDKLIELRVIFEQVTALRSAPPRPLDGGEEAGQFRLGTNQD